LDYFQFIPKDFINEKLNEKKIGQQILSIWFNRQKDGTMNTEILNKRGLYNANDNEFIIASSSKRGIAKLVDMGLELVDKSYILLFDFYNITSYRDFYNYNQTPKKERTQTGYLANVRAYVLKLEFDKNTATDFFTNYWIYPNDPDESKKIKAFNEAKFNFKIYNLQYQNINVSQDKKINKYLKRKTKDDFFRELVQKAFDNLINELTKDKSAFKTKAMVSSVKPISAKIGVKEDVVFEERFFVYENRLKKGKVKPKRVGVVKVYKVADNRNYSKGNTNSSSFYQIAGKKIDNQGMYLVSARDLGMNISSGTSTKGFFIRGELYISKYMKNLIKSGHSGKWLTSMNLYGDINFGDKEYQYPIGNVEYFSFLFGLGKSIYPSRFFHITPYAGIGFEQADWDNAEGYTASEHRYEYGLRLGLNLRHNIQLMADFGKIAKYGTATLEDSDGNTVEDYYGNAFNGRLGSVSSFGFRLMF